MTAENRFGTAANMIIEKIENDGKEVILAIDEKGLYLTTPDMVDRNIADVNRYGVNRDDFIATLTQLGYNPAELFENNRHLIETDHLQGKTAKKLNPIKASKRR